MHFGHILVLFLLKIILPATNASTNLLRDTSVFFSYTKLENRGHAAYLQLLLTMLWMNLVKGTRKNFFKKRDTFSWANLCSHCTKPDKVLTITIKNIKRKVPLQRFSIFFTCSHCNPLFSHLP